ncbi:MAG: Mur ligase family protein [Candidatus Limnocylindria bacterium]
MTDSGQLSYADAIAELTERGRFGVNLGLERVRRLMTDAGRPDRALRGALVGGTNGKGSVVAMAASVLVAAGLRVGTMPKPHLVDYRERVAVNGVPISEEAFASAVSRVLPAVRDAPTGAGHPTEFEVLTTVAIGELARQQVDLALVEVGMGGRLDATNVLDLGVSVVTNVQLDHEGHLGTTLAAIGTEKAAIIKPGNLAVTGARGRGARPIIERCTALGVPLRRAGIAGGYRSKLISTGWDGVVIDARTPARTLDDLRIGLLGAHQAENAMVAVAMVEAIAERHGIAVDEGTLRRGLADARWPGRLEVLSRGRGRILLDGAHNPDGARALARALADLDVRRPTIIFGAMRGKRVGAILRALAPLRPHFVFTRADDPGAHEPKELARTWRRIGGTTALVATDAESALSMARDDLVVVAGSLYLVGEVRGMIMAEAG